MMDEHTAYAERITSACFIPAKFEPPNLKANRHFTRVRKVAKEACEFDRYVDDQLTMGGPHVTHPADRQPYMKQNKV
jgi:hypothetical protein